MEYAAKFNELRRSLGLMWPQRRLKDNIKDKVVGHTFSNFQGIHQRVVNENKAKAKPKAKE